MTFPTALPFAGALYMPRRTGSEAEIYLSNIANLSSQSAETLGWNRLTYHSDLPLLSHELEDPAGHSYYYLLRRSRERFLLLSTSSELVDSLLKHTGQAHRMISPAIDVPRLVKELAEKPQVYVMSAVWARVDGYGQALRTLALYGSDLAEAKLFRTMLSEIIPYRVTLRNVRTHHDALTIGSRGEVAFNYRGSTSLHEVDQTFRFLSTSGYLQWENLLPQG